MKKFISVFLAFSLLGVPVYAQSNYSQEDLIIQAKEVCQIDDSFADFEIVSAAEQYGMKLYNCRWSDKESKKSAEVVIGSDGIIYSYYYYDRSQEKKSKVYTDSEGRKSAETFLKKALKERYDDLEFNKCFNDSDRYSFIYKIKYNDVAYSNTYVNISVDKYNNRVTDYYFPESIIGVKNSSFENTKTISEAEEVMKNNIQLGYKANFDYDTKEYDVKLLYRMKDYLLRADDLTSFAYNDMYQYAKGVTVENASADLAVQSLSPAEIEGIDDLKNAIAPDEAIKIYNRLFGDSVTESQVTISYNKAFDRDDYYLNIKSNDSDNYFYCTIDAEGRLVSYTKNFDTNEENANSKNSSEKARNAAQSMLNKFNYGYKTTELMENKNNFEYGIYSFNCNVIRNGHISFDERIDINTDSNGNIISVYAQYLPDEIFNLNTINVSAEQAFAKAEDKYDFKPYYSIKTKYSDSSQSYEAVPVYGFDELFSIDASTGEFLDFYGNTIIEEGVKLYTDLNNQWYAEEAISLAYMGYTFKGDEFKGDEPLTYGDLRELNKSNYYRNINWDNYDQNATMTRYEFAEYLLDTMDIKNINKYNEIFIKPFDDVSYQYTGTIAILKAMGVVNGKSFRGNDTITRGEAVVMIYRCLTAE